MEHSIGKAFGNLMRAAWIEYERDRARYLAVAMIYYAIVSLIPLLLLLLGTLGLLLRYSATASEARQQMLLGIEASFGAELRITITGLLDSLQEQSIVATVISLAGLLLTASVLFGHLRQGFRAIWKYDPPLVSGPLRVVLRAAILEKIVAFVLVLGGGGLLVAGLLTIAATQWLGGLVGNLTFFNDNTGWLLAALSSWILSAITFAALLRFLPPVPISWRDVWLAALLCSVAWVVACEFMAIYGDFFGDNQSAYGVIGGMLAIMIWMKIVSQVLFFGAELCKVVAAQRSRQSADARLNRDNAA